jgi:prepilin-type N-terminal cleavage/methylation domain-containing protein
MKDKSSNIQGFTLIEVLVGFAILAGAILMTFKIFGDGLLNLNVSQNRSGEMLAAEREIEFLQISESLQEGSAEAIVKNFRFLITVKRISDLKKSQLFMLQPFKVQIFRAGSTASGEPLLETILIAKPAQ